MTEDWGALLKARWDKNPDWSELGKFVHGELVASFQSGVTAYKRESGVEALRGLLEVLDGKKP